MEEKECYILKAQFSFYFAYTSNGKIHYKPQIYNVFTTNSMKHLILNMN
jgi:hypothetical protein